MSTNVRLLPVIQWHFKKQYFHWTLLWCQQMSGCCLLFNDILRNNIFTALSYSLSSYDLELNEREYLIGLCNKCDSRFSSDLGRVNKRPFLKFIVNADTSSGYAATNIRMVDELERMYNNRRLLNKTWSGRIAYVAAKIRVELLPNATIEWHMTPLHQQWMWNLFPNPANMYGSHGC